MPDPSVFDPDAVMETGKHVGIGLGSSGLMGVFMMWLRGREARESAARSEAIAVQLGVINVKLDQMKSEMSKFATVERLDALEKRIAAIESKRK